MDADVGIYKYTCVRTCLTYLPACHVNQLRAWLTYLRAWLTYLGAWLTYLRAWLTYLRAWLTYLGAWLTYLRAWLTYLGAWLTYLRACPTNLYASATLHAAGMQSIAIKHRWLSYGFVSRSAYMHCPVALQHHRTTDLVSAVSSCCLCTLTHLCCYSFSIKAQLKSVKKESRRPAQCTSWP
jgi:hypothetical protein